MSIAAGSRLGPYEILAAVGAGGMGEVYKARDTRLERVVAIKVLPAHTAQLPEVRQRFEREARSVSALNHSGICTLHDIGREGETDYLVMEFLQGETLAERLKKGPLALTEMLRVAAQVAEALDSAHRAGIIHRDLKPANIMLTRDGAKVMDFGLAKMTQRTSGAMESDSAADTLTAPLTMEGAILGTLPYMAPEQLEGAECDARADIFALGLVMHEMLAGKRAFAGESRATLIAEVMRGKPAPPAGAPPALAHLIERCLEKDPEKRWQSARDLAIELGWLQQQEERPHASAPAAGAGRRERAVWMGACVVLAGLVALSRFYSRSGRGEEFPVEFQVAAPADAAYFASGMACVVSPDGRQLALRATGRDGKDYLWVRAMDSSTARLLPDTAGATGGFFWSPDNRYLAFLSAGKLRKIDIHGGPALELADFPAAAAGATGTWGEDGTILFAPGGNECIYRLSSQGGGAARATQLDVSRGEQHGNPRFLPDGRNFLFVKTSNRERHAIYLGSLDGSGAKLLIADADQGAYTRPRGTSQGYILFLRNLSLLAQRFDEDRQQVDGDPVVIAGRALPYNRFSVSANGVVAYRSGSIMSSLIWMDRDGKALATLPEKGDYRQIALSPDESLFAVSRVDGGASSNIWLVELPRGTMTRLTSDSTYNWFPVWSPDGRRIIFASERDAPGSRWNLYIRPADGAGADEVLLKSPIGKLATSWSGDGRFVAYWAADPKTRGDLWILPMSGGNPFPFLQTQYGELQPEFSPDGGWIAYTSDESGTQEVYVRKFEKGPASGGAKRISTSGGSHPKWRRDGKELFYLSRDLKLMSVEVEISATLKAGTPRPLFQTHTRLADVYVPYAVASKGQRFLVNTAPEAGASDPVTVLTDWNPGRR